MESGRRHDRVQQGGLRHHAAHLEAECRSFASGRPSPGSPSKLVPRRRKDRLHVRGSEWKWQAVHGSSGWCRFLRADARPANLGVLCKAAVEPNRQSNRFRDEQLQRIHRRRSGGTGRHSHHAGHERRKSLLVAGWIEVGLRPRQRTVCDRAGWIERVQAHDGTTPVAGVAIEGRTSRRPTLISL